MIIKDVICPFCGCLCDDLAVEVENNKVIDVKHACKISAAKIRGHNRIEAPMMRESKTDEFREVSYDEAINEAAKILVDSKRPLMYGWASGLCEMIKKGVLLAEEVGGILDNTASVCHGPSTLGVQEKGIPTGTLGQFANRSDVVIFWGCNPVQAHPRHMSRYSVFAKGFFTNKGRKDRKIVVVDVRKTDTAEMADEYIQVNPGEDYKLLAAFRAAVADKADVIPDTVSGVSKEKIVELAAAMKDAKYGIIYFGMGVTQTRCKYKNIDIAVSLTTDLNAYTKFSIIPMRGHYNVTGAGQVFAWETGYPNGIDMSRGVPYYNPGETCSNDMLMREELDSAFVIGGDAGAHFPAQSIARMAKIPVIQVDPFHNPTTEMANIVIPVKVSGVELAGTAYRMDSVCLRMRKLVDVDFPSDEEVLDKILAKVKEIKGVS